MGEGPACGQFSPLPASPSFLPRTWAQPRRLQPDSPQAAVVSDACGGWGWGGEGSRGCQLGCQAWGSNSLPLPRRCWPELLSLLERQEFRVTCPHPVLRDSSSQAPVCSPHLGEPTDQLQAAGQLPLILPSPGEPL